MIQTNILDAQGFWNSYDRQGQGPEGIARGEGFVLSRICHDLKGSSRGVADLWVIERERDGAGDVEASRRGYWLKLR